MAELNEAESTKDTKKTKKEKKNGLVMLLQSMKKKSMQTEG